MLMVFLSGDLAVVVRLLTTKGGLAMRFPLIKNPFSREPATRKRKRVMERRRHVYATEGSYKTIRDTAAEFNLSLVNALALICAKATEKIVEEQLLRSILTEKSQLS